MSPLFLSQSLVSCMRGAFLGGVIKRMSKDYRHCRGGLPDLVVWNTSNNTYKVRPHHMIDFWIWYCSLCVDFRHSVVPDSFTSIVLQHAMDCFNVGCLVVVAGGGEGAKWPAVPEAADLAGWASEAGGRCGGVSRDGDRSQRSSSGISRHRGTDWKAAN